MTGQTKPIGIYIHIPFCLSKCPYCDFYSQKPEENTIKAYTDAVCRAIKKGGQKSRTVDTVYFGGGTPPILGVKNLHNILNVIYDNFRVDSPEITIEANPAAMCGEKSGGEFKAFRSAGFNRISIGVQSAIDSELKALGRLHDAETARQGIIDAYDAGFANISADLMLGIPQQTRESLSESIDFLTALPLSHISAYMLKIEENTPFYKQKKAGLCPDEDMSAEMYLDAVKRISNLGFEQYEISNFAKSGAASRHNLKYWRCEEYLGFGPSAHSFFDGKRFYFPRDINAFIKAENPFDLAIFDGEGGGFEEYAMLRLRLCEGLDLRQAKLVYEIDTDEIAEKAATLARNGLVAVNSGVVSLTPEGFLLSNAVTAGLLF